MPNKRCEQDRDNYNYLFLFGGKQAIGPVFRELYAIRYPTKGNFIAGIKTGDWVANER